MTTEQQEEIKELSQFIAKLQELKSVKVFEEWKSGVKVYQTKVGNLLLEYPAKVKYNLNVDSISLELANSIAVFADPLIAKAKEEMKKIIDAA